MYTLWCACHTTTMGEARHGVFGGLSLENGALERSLTHTASAQSSARRNRTGMPNIAWVVMRMEGQ